MNKQQFTNLMKQGNRVIERGIIELEINNRVVSVQEFDDIHDESDAEVCFSYLDKPDMENWRGERTPFLGLLWDDLIRVSQISTHDNNLLGNYLIKAELKTMTLNIYFDVTENIKFEEYGLIPFDELCKVMKDSTDAEKDNKQTYLDLILAHTGSFLININGADFIEPNNFGLEAFNLVFSSIKSICKNELLAFDNSTMAPSSYTEKNVPVYTMDLVSSFYIKIGDIVSIEELDVEEYADVFEYPSKRIFNITLNNNQLITIGLYQ